MRGLAQGPWTVDHPGRPRDAPHPALSPEYGGEENTETDMRVLIVDDNDIELSILENGLVNAGYEVQCASDGRQCWRSSAGANAGWSCPTGSMPVMTGIDLCRQVRRGDFPYYVYFLLLTGRDSLPERLEGMAAGADGFIPKPYEQAELIAQIRAGERVVALETRDVAIFALAKLAESRDPETGAHLERVQNYSPVLARHLAGHAEVPRRDRRRIRPAAVQHQPAARHRQSRHPRPRAAQAGQADAARVRHHEAARADRGRHAGRRPYSGSPRPGSCRWPATSPPAPREVRRHRLPAGPQRRPTSRCAAGSWPWPTCTTP